jgi:DNA-binding transcriptional ArsR family regulator
MEMTAALAALGGLAQETRLAIFLRLVEAGPAGLAAGAVAEALHLPAATLSFHLKEMRHAGLVSARRDGRCVIYAARFETLEGLVAYLTENCCRASGGACITRPAGGKRAVARRASPAAAGSKRRARP